MSQKLKMRWMGVTFAVLTLVIEIAHLRSQYKLEQSR